MAIKRVIAYHKGQVKELEQRELDWKLKKEEEKNKAFYYYINSSLEHILRSFWSMTILKNTRLNHVTSICKLYKKTNLSLISTKI